MERPVTPKLLATFIEYAATGKVMSIEWQRFVVAHYPDPQMEEARRKSVTILLGPGLPVAGKDLLTLRAIAHDLRSALRNQNRRVPEGRYWPK
jgi:hypothetical protein